MCTDTSTGKETSHQFRTPRLSLVMFHSKFGQLRDLILVQPIKERSAAVGDGRKPLDSTCSDFLVQKADTTNVGLE